MSGQADESLEEVLQKATNGIRQGLTRLARVLRVQGAMGSVYGGDEDAARKALAAMTVEERAAVAAAARRLAELAAESG